MSRFVSKNKYTTIKTMHTHRGYGLTVVCKYLDCREE